jgi:hypothetical protein
LAPDTFGQDDNALLLVDAHGASENCLATPKQALARDWLDCAENCPKIRRKKRYSLKLNDMMNVDVKILDPRLTRSHASLRHAWQRRAGLAEPVWMHPLRLQPNAWQLIPTGMAIHLKDPGLCSFDVAAFRLGPQTWHRVRQFGGT